MSCEVKTSSTPSMYDNADRNLLMAHVQKHFGTISGIGQAQLPSGGALDILALTPPSRKHIGRLFSAQTSPSAGEETILLTIGAGARPMSVPKDSELPPRAEYLIRLPADWNVQSGEERDAWPVRLLMNIASLPETTQSYNAWGHTFSFSQGLPFADNTGLCAAMLTGMNDREGQCRLHDGEAVTFYEVIPLYAEELTFVAEQNPVALIDEFIRYNLPRVVTPDRPNVAVMAKRRAELVKNFQSMESGKRHELTRHMNALPLEERIALKESLAADGGLTRQASNLVRQAMSFFKGGK